MPHEFSDGFDHNTNLAMKWGATAGIGTVGVNATAGRDGRGAMVADKAYAVWSGPAASRRTLGFALKGGNFSFSWPGAPVALFRASGVDYCAIRWNNDFTFSIVRSSTGAVLGTSTATLPAGTWGYLEFRYTVSTSTAAGDVVLRLDHAPIVQVPAGTASGSAGNTVNEVVVGSPTGALNAFTATVDDVVILDATEDFWGDVTVEGHVAAGPGFYSQFAAVGDSPNWKCVDDPSPDGSTTYISGSGLGQRDNFTLGPLVQNAQQIRALTVAVTAKQSGPIPAAMAPFFRAGGVDYDQASVPLSGTYAMKLSRYLINPATGVAWTPAEVAALEPGVKTTP